MRYCLDRIGYGSKLPSRLSAAVLIPAKNLSAVPAARSITLSSSSRTYVTCQARITQLSGEIDDAKSELTNAQSYNDYLSTTMDQITNSTSVQQWIDSCCQVALA